MVLLNNNLSLLPLNSSSIHSLAISGSVAYNNPIWVGNGSAEVYLPYYDYPLTGISNRASPAISVSYAQGDNGGSITQAVQYARQADVAIVCVGQSTGEGHDRMTSSGQLGFSLPSDQDALITAV